MRKGGGHVTYDVAEERNEEADLRSGTSKRTSREIIDGEEEEEETQQQLQ